jgi:hypothetical protein
MDSLNVTTGAMPVVTDVAPLAGLNELTVGGVVSMGAAVVNEEVTSAAKAFPAESFTPAPPPFTTIV